MRKFYPVNQLPDVLVLGAQTEHGVTDLCFDCSVWLDIWPELDLSIWVTPPAGDQYPAGTRMDGKILIWPVIAADTASVGKGRIEIMGVSEGKKKLSAIADTLITATSTDTSPNPPPAHEAWVEKVALDALAAKNAAGEAEEFARAAEEAKETAIEAANAVGDVIGAKNEALDEISNQKETSVKAVQDQQAVSVKTVQDQQSASVMAVDQAKNAAVKALHDESVNQQNAVAAKGKETVDSIPADYTNLVGKVGQLSEEMLTKATAINCEASGALVSITDAAAHPAVSLISHIEPVQEGEGDHIQDNGRTISGWNKVVAQRMRKNLIDLTTVRARYCVVNDDGSVRLNINNGTYGELVLENIIHMIRNGMPITFSAKSGIPDKYLSIVIIGHRIDGGGYQEKYSVLSGRTVSMVISGFTSFEEISIRFARSGEYYNDTTTVLEELQLEIGSTATAYEPYNGQTLTADLPETVYSGTLDWGTGVLTSTLDANGDELTEPKVLQLTPQQMDMLKGVNNVWSDTGDSDLVYVADSKMYIDNKFAELQNAILAQGANI